jgi:acetyltransferase
MAPLGTEVIVGSINDPTFGPTVMFGLGGIFVEVLKDVTFRVAPVNKEQVTHMINEIRSVAILAGARGESPRDRDSLADLLYHYAIMIYDLRDEIAETDANPVLVYEEGKGVKAVDARIILKKK